MGELKSSWQIAMEKAKKMEGEEEIILTSKQKDEIAEIRKTFEAKMAEVEILVKDPEKKKKEMEWLRRERDKKIESIYQKARENKKQ